MQLLAEHDHRCAERGELTGALLAAEHIHEDDTVDALLEPGVTTKDPFAVAWFAVPIEQVEARLGEHLLDPDRQLTRVPARDHRRDEADRANSGRSPVARALAFATYCSRSTAVRGPAGEWTPPHSGGRATHGSPSPSRRPPHGQHRRSWPAKRPAGAPAILTHLALCGVASV